MRVWPGNWQPKKSGVFNGPNDCERLMPTKTMIYMIFKDDSGLGGGRRKVFWCPGEDSNPKDFINGFKC